MKKIGPKYLLINTRLERVAERIVRDMVEVHGSVFTLPSNNPRFIAARDYIGCTSEELTSALANRVGAVLADCPDIHEIPTPKEIWL